MKTVTIEKDKLLAVLFKNRTEHRRVFEEAQKGYRAKAIQALDMALRDAIAGMETRTHIKLEAPIDQTKDYDRAIQMLQMSVDEEIQLSEQEFAEYILDDWSWKSQFTTTHTLYAGVGGYVSSQ